MPNFKRRGGRDNRGGHYYKGPEHDDRVPIPYSGPHQRDGYAFKNKGATRRHKNNRQQGWDNKLRVLLDDDVDMSGSVRSDGRINKFIDNRRERKRWSHTLQESPTGWYKIIIRNGHKYPKDYILKLLTNFIQPQPLLPLGYKITKEEASFAVDNHETAVQLQNADRKIVVQDGWKLVIRVRPFTPLIEIDPKLSAAIKAVMATRYNPSMKALDLKKFHCDPSLLLQDFICPLNRPNLMMAVLDIVKESIPDLVALDLSENKLNQIEHMKIMIEKCPNLKILHLGGNRLRDIKQLDALKGLQLEELVLDGNTLCDKFNNQDTYIRDVRQRFPKVIRLDGTDLPPPILFDVEDEGTLPISQPSFMAAPEGAEMVKQFIQQYYQLYDGFGNRNELHQAYHDQAQFSYDVYVPSGDPGYASLVSYMKDNRNLLRVNHLDRRIRNLKIGKANIISALNSLPKTAHDPTSFIVDLVVFTPQLIQLNVCGLFNETSDKPALRAFSRVFIIVPVGPGFCIINDQLSISLPTQEQIKKVNKQKAEAAASIAPLMNPQPSHLVSPGAQPGISAVPVSPVQVVAGVSGTPPQPDLATKQQMVATLAMNSGMNLLWSEKCLNETNWNYDQAMFAFNKLHKAGSIPPEAFVK